MKNFTITKAVPVAPRDKKGRFTYDIVLDVGGKTVSFVGVSATTLISPARLANYALCRGVFLACAGPGAKEAFAKELFEACRP